MRRFGIHKLFSYAEQGKAALVSPAQGRVLRIYGASLANRSGGAAALGILKKFGDAAWKLGTEAAGVITDATASIQAGGTVDVFTTTVNQGFVVQSVDIFHLIGLAVTQGQTGAPVYTVQYWNGAAYVNVPQLNTRDLSTTGDKLYLFAAPSDWALGGPGVDTDKYGIRLRATTASGQAVQANDAWVAELVAFQDDVPHNGTWNFAVPDSFPEQFEAEQAFMPYFSTAAAGNLVTLRYFQEQ